MPRQRMARLIVVAAARAGLSTLPAPLAAQGATVTGIVADVGVRGGVSVHWDALTGATRYVVVRWHTGDPACCKRISHPESTGATPTWQDELSKAGTYGYRVYATTEAASYAGEVRLTFTPGTASTSTSSLSAAGDGTIKETTSNPTSTGTLATAAPQPIGMIVSVAGPAQLTTSTFAPQGWGILLNWTAVPNATGYRILRKPSGSTAPASQAAWLDRGPIAARGFVRGIDLDVEAATDYTYWVEAVLSGGSTSSPSPVSTVKSGMFLASVSNLRATVGGTTSIVMPGALSIRGAMPGSYITWEWDPFPALYRYEISYEIVGGLEGFGPVVERAIVMTTDEPPRIVPVLRPVPQGKTVKFCVSTLPQGGDPSQPLAEPQLLGMNLPFGPIKCMSTTVP